MTGMYISLWEKNLYFDMTKKTCIHVTLLEISQINRNMSILVWQETCPFCPFWYDRKQVHFGVTEKALLQLHVNYTLFFIEILKSYYYNSTIIMCCSITVQCKILIYVIRHWIWMWNLDSNIFKTTDIRLSQGVGVIYGAIIAVR